MSLNFAVLASGHGGNLQAIINAVKAKKIKDKKIPPINTGCNCFLHGTKKELMGKQKIRNHV